MASSVRPVGSCGDKTPFCRNRDKGSIHITRPAIKTNFQVTIMPPLMWHFICSRVMGNLIMDINIMHEPALITCRPRVKGYRPVSRAERVGVQMGWTYDCSSVTPPFASSSKCGVSTVGLCQDTSCHPEINRSRQRGLECECRMILKLGCKLLGVPLQPLTVLSFNEKEICLPCSNTWKRTAYVVPVFLSTWTLAV